MTDIALPRTGSPLPRDFFTRGGIALARDLLGKTLVKRTEDGELSAVITETEAYMGVTDRASHAYGGRKTERTRVMYREGGISYVYLIYGLYSCMNVTANREGNAEAVLIRAGIPFSGHRWMLANLKRASRAKKAVFPEDPGGWSGDEWAARLNGPGRLCAALGITKADNARDLTADPGFFIRDDGFRPAEIAVSARVGIDYAGEDRDRPWRFTANGMGETKAPPL